MKAPRSTVRFAALVAAAGQPEPVVLWLKPSTDKNFQAAVTGNRILTVNQETVGSKKDFGVVGFHKGKNVSYWKFPKSLRAFENKRIVGIDYSLLKTPKLASAQEFLAKPARKPKRPPPPPPTKAPRPAVYRFRVHLRATATAEHTQELEATSQQEAKAKAAMALQGAQFDFNTAQQTKRVIKIEKLGPTST